MKIKFILFTLFLMLIKLYSYSQSYDFGKTKNFLNVNPAVALSDDIKSYLDALTTYMYANENFKVKISGFSNNSGNYNENEKSSIERIKIITDYLVSKGISNERIIEKAEGSKMPISPNDSPENKALNNRIEINVMHVSTETTPNEKVHEIHSNHISIFGGVSTFLESKESFATAGLEFEHRLKVTKNLFGLGIFTEIVFTEENEYIAGIPVFIHPYHGLKLLIAPGVNIVNDNIEMLVRGGIGYDIFFGKFAITPNFNIDYVSEHFILIYGLSFGIGF